MNILVTGGAGYIGSHTCLVLLEAGHQVSVLDNLCNGSQVALQRVQELAGKPLTFLHGDVRNRADVDHALAGTSGLLSLRRYVNEGWNTVVF